MIESPRLRAHSQSLTGLGDVPALLRVESGDTLEHVGARFSRPADHLERIMNVTFRRTGERRYAVILQAVGKPPQVMHPAPGFDSHIPHDLVHYTVEAELGLTAGVYGRAARGGGGFISEASTGDSARDRARERRKQLRREASLRSVDETNRRDMETSERLAAVCDLTWRRRHGQTPDGARPTPRMSLSEEDRRRVERVVTQLERLAPRWNALAVGEELTFAWPSLEPQTKAQAPARRDK